MWVLKSGELYVSRLFDVSLGPFYTTALKAALKFDSDIGAADWHEQAAMKYRLLMHLEPEEVHVAHAPKVLPQRQEEARPVAPEARGEEEEGTPQAEHLMGDLLNGEPGQVDPCSTLTSSSSESPSGSSSGA